MGRTGVLVVVLAACLAFAPLEWAPVRNIQGCALIEAKVGQISRTVLMPIDSIGIGDIIAAIIDALGQLIDR